MWLCLFGIILSKIINRENLIVKEKILNLWFSFRKTRLYSSENEW